MKIIIIFIFIVVLTVFGMTRGVSKSEEFKTTQLLSLDSMHKNILLINKDSVCKYIINDTLKVGNVMYLGQRYVNNYDSAFFHKLENDTISSCIIHNNNFNWNDFNKHITNNNIHIRELNIIFTQSEITPEILNKMNFNRLKIILNNYKITFDTLLYLNQYLKKIMIFNGEFQLYNEINNMKNIEDISLYSCKINESDSIKIRPKNNLKSLTFEDCKIQSIPIVLQNSPQLEFVMLYDTIKIKFPYDVFRSDCFYGMWLQGSFDSDPLERILNLSERKIDLHIRYNYGAYNSKRLTDEQIEILRRKKISMSFFLYKNHR